LDTPHPSPLISFTPKGNYPCRDLPLTSFLNAMDYSEDHIVAKRYYSFYKGLLKQGMISSKRNLQKQLTKNLKSMKSLECKSTHVNKNGHKKGKHNYICVECGRQFIECYQPITVTLKELSMKV
jgi:hypothetical protein